MSHELRAARLADVSGICGLLGELGYRTDTTTLARRMTHWGDRPDRFLLVADDGADLLGLLALSLTPRLEADTSWAQVVALVVAGRARRRGIGRDLLHLAETLARDASCDTVIINSARDRESAHAFYRSQGYRDRCEDHAQFTRRLEPGE